MCSFLCPLHCTILFCLCNILLFLMHFIISNVFFSVSLLFVVCLSRCAFLLFLLHSIISFVFLLHFFYFVCCLSVALYYWEGAAAGGGPWEPSQPEEGRGAPPGLLIYNI